MVCGTFEKEFMERAWKVSGECLLIEDISSSLKIQSILLF